MKTSFGSTYSIKYDYMRNNVANGEQGRLYKSEIDAVDEFIKEIDRQHIGKGEVSSFDPEKKIYYFDVKNKKDESMERLARLFGIEMKKAHPNDMQGTQIVSVGSCGNGSDGELKAISSLISAYELRNN